MREKQKERDSEHSDNPKFDGDFCSHCHGIIESAFIVRIYSSPPSPGALKISWLLLIRTMESALGVQILRSDPRSDPVLGNGQRTADLQTASRPYLKRPFCWAKDFHEIRGLNAIAKYDQIKTHKPSGPRSVRGESNGCNCILLRYRLVQQLRPRRLPCSRPCYRQISGIQTKGLRGLSVSQVQHAGKTGFGEESATG